MEVFIDGEKIPFLESHGVDVLREQAPVYGFGEIGPVGFGTETLSYLLHFTRTFPKGFEMLTKSLFSRTGFLIELKEKDKVVAYKNCQWQKQNEAGDEWEQSENLTAISFERMEEQ